MGVDWLACEKCGETFPDCGDFVWCNCGVVWCSDDCAEQDGYRIDSEETDECEEETSCKYCRKEDFEDKTLLEYTLELLNLNREELIERYKNKKED